MKQRKLREDFSPVKSSLNASRKTADLEYIEEKKTLINRDVNRMAMA